MPDNKKSTGFSTSKLREYYQGKIMPTGGLRNQVLQKKSTADYDVAWSDNVPNTAIKYSITLTSTGWTSEGNVYTQPITVSGIDATSILDIKLDTTAFNAFDTANSKYVYINNNNGSASVVSIGGAPSTDVSVVVIRQDSIIYNGLASIAVSGSFTNEQIVGCAVDITGLTVTATYNDTTTSNVTNSVSVSPATWASSGEQTLTISYSEYGVAKTCTKTCTVSPVVPASLTVNGTPVKQYVDTNVNVTGLTFTATYNNGTTASVVGVTHSPSTWTESGLAKDITFSYTEGSTTITATKTVRVYDEKALLSIACSGSWTNTQRKNSAVDITGLTVTATFNDETTSDVTSSVTTDPVTWTSTGSQTAELSYTYDETIKTCFTPAVTVEDEQRVAQSITCEGSSARQFVSHPVDITGLTFTVIYNIGSPEVVTPNISPSSWSGTAGPQTATFSYDNVSTTRQFNVENNNYESLVCEGEWTNARYTDGPIDTTGLTFKMQYSDGTKSAAVNASKNISVWGSTAGQQTVTFSYTSGGTTRSVDVTTTVSQKTLVSIACTGTWSNSQYVNTAVDMTGLTVTAHYNNGADDITLTSDQYTKSESTWATLGNQTITIGFGGLTTTTPSVNVILSPIASFNVEGDWQHTQYVGVAPDLTGLTFYILRQNGDRQNIASPTTVTPETWASTGVQTAEFTYSNFTCSKSAYIYANTVVSLAYNTGATWATQYLDEAIDITGITFTATFANGTTQDVTNSITKSPATWGNTGSRTATFSYTSGGVTKSCTKTLSVINPVVSMSTGNTTWTNTQYVSTNIDTTGLVFTVTKHNNATATVTPTITVPASGKWSSTEGEQTATFSYTDEFNATVTCDKSANVQYLLVGGRIFYVTGNLDNYTFYDSSKNVIATKTVAGLANAYYYKTISAPSSAHVYVYNNTDNLVNKLWGKKGTSIGVTTDGIGKGKTNTAYALGISGWESDSVFSYISSINSSSVGGCSDWFIPSKAELDKLNESGIVNWFSDKMIYSSVEFDSDYAYRWYPYSTSWAKVAKNTSLYAVSVRSF